MYILAGKKRLEEVRDRRAGGAAPEGGADRRCQEDAQAYNDLANLCNRFEKKLHDLELTRMISIQMGPQTRLLQNNDTLMLEKIQSSLVNTIPLWKSQMVLALGMEHSRQATAAQSAVTDMTNELLQQERRHAQDGHHRDRQGGRAQHRGHRDAAAHQRAADLHAGRGHEASSRRAPRSARRPRSELGRIEGELKQKLLELRG